MNELLLTSGGPVSKGDKTLFLLQADKPGMDVAYLSALLWYVSVMRGK